MSERGKTKPKITAFFQFRNICHCYIWRIYFPWFLLCRRWLCVINFDTRKSSKSPDELRAECGCGRSQHGNGRVSFLGIYQRAPKIDKNYGPGSCGCARVPGLGVRRVRWVIYDRFGFNSELISFFPSVGHGHDEWWHGCVCSSMTTDRHHRSIGTVCWMIEGFVPIFVLKCVTKWRGNGNSSAHNYGWLCEKGTTP